MTIGMMVLLAVLVGVIIGIKIRDLTYLQLLIIAVVVAELSILADLWYVRVQ